MRSLFLLSLSLCLNLAWVSDGVGQEKQTEQDPIVSQGVFSNRDEYQQFFGGLKSLNDPEINAMLPVLNDLALGNPIGQTANAFGLNTDNATMDLLADKSVRAELEIVDEQFEDMKSMNQRLRDGLSDRLRSMDLSDPKEVANAVRSMNLNVRSEMEGMFLPHQLKRLKQLALQRQLERRGLVDVIVAEPIRSELDVTSGQEKTLRQAEKEIEEKLEREIQELRAKARKELLSNLKSDQRRRFEELVGEAFLFAKSEKKNEKKPEGKKPSAKSK